MNSAHVNDWTVDLPFVCSNKNPVMYLKIHHREFCLNVSDQVSTDQAIFEVVDLILTQPYIFLLHCSKKG